MEKCAKPRTKNKLWQPEADKEESTTFEEEVFGHIQIIGKLRGSKRRLENRNNASSWQQKALTRKVMQARQHIIPPHVKFKSKGWCLPHIVHRSNKWVVAPAKPPPLVQIKY